MMAKLGRRKTNHLGRVFQTVLVAHEGEVLQVDVVVRPTRGANTWLSNSEAKVVAMASVSDSKLVVECPEYTSEPLAWNEVAAWRESLTECPRDHAIRLQ